MGKKERKTRESRQREIRESTERAQREHRESTERAQRERERERQKEDPRYLSLVTFCVPVCMCTRVPLCLHRGTARDRVAPGRNAGHRAACEHRQRAAMSACGMTHVNTLWV